MKIFNCDLHIHTCLSPCADLDMYPGMIVDRAKKAGLDLIAICDHNSSENASFVVRSAMGTITVLPGMELTTREETHILAIFSNIEDLAKLQAIVYEKLHGKNDEEKFGVQAVVNENAEVEYINDRLLIGAADIPLNEAIELIHEFNGIAIAAHIDRECFSVLSQLGFIGRSMNFDALEVSHLTGIKEGRKKYRELSEYPIITSSDAHFPGDIGSVYTRILMETPSLAELKMAFRNENGRTIAE